MKRKVVLHGPSTLTVSLPVSWVKKFHVERGDELDVQEYGRELRINADKSFSPGEKSIDIGNLRRVGRSSVTASYRQGHNEIRLAYDDPAYLGVIQDLVSKEMIGFETVKQRNGECVIKDLAGHDRNEFDFGLNMLWRLLIDLSSESLDALEKKSVQDLKNIPPLDDSVNKFTNYCLRLLTKKGHTDFNKTSLYYYLVKRLESIGDLYKDMCFFYAHHVKMIDTELIFLLSTVNEHLAGLHALFYGYDKEKAELLFSQTSDFSKKVILLERGSLWRIHSICGGIRDLLSLLVDLNL